MLVCWENVCVCVFIICITIALNYSNHFCKWALFSTPVSGFWQAMLGKHLLSGYTEKHLSMELLSADTGAVIRVLGTFAIVRIKEEHLPRAQEGQMTAY